jgi:hypothetical protein
VAYLQDLLDYSENVQSNNLWAQGWEMDEAGKFDSILNLGFMNRRARFLALDTDALNKRLTTTDKFREDPVTFIGLLHTNLRHCSQGLIPGTEFTVKIDFNEPDFVILQSASVLTGHTLVYEEATLYVPVATLNQEINKNLLQHLKSEDALYNYRELVCQTHAIHRGHLIYASPDLRAPTQAAIKIYVAFVRAKAYLGNASLNPFDFRR